MAIKSGVDDFVSDSHVTVSAHLISGDGKQASRAELVRIICDAPLAHPCMLLRHGQCLNADTGRLECPHAKVERVRSVQRRAPGFADWYREAKAVADTLHLTRPDDNLRLMPVGEYVFMHYANRNGSVVFVHDDHVTPSNIGALLQRGRVLFKRSFFTSDLIENIFCWLVANHASDIASALLYDVQFCVPELNPYPGDKIFELAELSAKADMLKKDVQTWSLPLSRVVNALYTHEESTTVSGVRQTDIYVQVRSNYQATAAVAQDQAFSWRIDTLYSKNDNKYFAVNFVAKPDAVVIVRDLDMHERLLASGAYCLTRHLWEEERDARHTVDPMAT